MSHIAIDFWDGTEFGMELSRPGSTEQYCVCRVILRLGTATALI